MKVGFGVSDITPAVGTEPRGSYRPRVMSGVHDRLLASACVVDDGNTRAALVGIDAGCIMRATGDAARAAIAQRTGIPAENVIISASHTHAGGPTISTFLAKADPEYAKVCTRGIADAVTAAWERRGDASVGSDFGRVGGIHFNRRFLMRDGREATHPGKMNPDIVRPAGSVDEKVGMMVVRDASEKIAGVVVNFGCHCTVAEEGSEYSADYVHYLREHLRRTLGPDVGIVFLQGACGDVTQIDNRSENVEKGHAWADMMGEKLAAEAARVVKGMTFAHDARVHVAGRRVPIAIREGDMCEKPRVGLGSGEFWEKMYEAEKPHVAAMRAARPIVECEVRGIRVGELAIVSNGGELFCQPALDIQSASKHAKTWVVTLANEYVGYVPTASAHFAGGYEGRTARSSFLEVSAAQKIVEASVAVLRDL